MNSRLPNYSPADTVKAEYRLKKNSNFSRTEQRINILNMNIHGIRLVPVYPKIFKILIHASYFLFIPFRKYLDSAKKYLPYIAVNYNFSTQNSQKYGLMVPFIDDPYIRKVNDYAIHNIFENTNLTIEN